MVGRFRRRLWEVAVHTEPGPRCEGEGKRCLVVVHASSGQIENALIVAGWSLEIAHDTKSFRTED
jgi:hypothetical protein